ncbi:5220_t:CDS:1, partial [Ambispora leptoticha]
SFESEFQSNIIINNITKNVDKQKRKLAPVHDYLNVLEDGTRICKACDG